jgi:predicted amidophosphoribosyltransferase
MDINPQQLTGHWKAGFALDLHTSSSTPIRAMKTVKMMVDGVEKEMQVLGDITGWDTKRPPIAEELYKLKYWKEKHRAEAIGTEATTFLQPKLPIWNINLIIPIPPSDTTREFQPVYEIAKQISSRCNLPIDFNVLKKLKPTSQLKEIEEPEKRKEVLKDAFSIGSGSLSGKNVLLFDDLYRSGETLNAVCDIIINQGKAASVYVLTITKTRTKR